MTWPTKRQRQRQRKRQRQWQIHLENTFKERSLRLLTFETFHQSDEKHDLTNKKTTRKTNTKTITNDKYIKSLQWAIFETLAFETFDQSDEKTWPDQQKKQWERQWRWQIHLENTPKEGFLKTFWIPLIPTMPHFSTKGKQPSYISSVPAPTPTTLSPAAQGSPPPFSPSSWLSNPTPRCNTYFNPTLGKIMWL